MSELDAAIVDAFQVGYEREGPGHKAGRLETPLRKRTTRPKDARIESRKKKIREVAELKVVGAAYCEALDDRNIQTPHDWQVIEGCPKRYLDAFNHEDRILRKKWRQRIANEKCKATSRQHTQSH